MSAYDAIVYDLDGTLVELAVDWEATANDGLAALRAAGIDPPKTDLWSLFEVADATGHRPTLEAIVSEHERAGARNSRLLETASELPQSVPVAVCSLNCQRACEIALERHSLADHVDTVVGRDTVSTEKPDPEGLLTAIDRIGGSPAQTVFIGDSPRDERTAQRAGTAFEYV
ncbi:HAD family hydrolase [Halocatena halophila]|uniref:HAD family hydrolase n=1 Tax=Halocatena halophila TaxID=2814576 RepID=UPI002ED4C369